jgi:hypothetical protein
MRIKDLFTVPEGKPITEKTFYRVLICTVCSMIFTMSCLVGTTWALFSVSVENQDNKISISEVTVALNQEYVPSIVQLKAGTYDVKVSYRHEADSLSQVSKAYVIFRLGTEELGYIALGGDDPAEKTVKITAAEDSELHYKITWKRSELPENLPLLDDVTSSVTKTETTETTEATDSADATESTDSTDSTDAADSTDSADSTESTESTDNTETTE